MYTNASNFISFHSIPFVLHSSAHAIWPSITGKSLNKPLAEDNTRLGAPPALLAVAARSLQCGWSVSIVWAIHATMESRSNNEAAWRSRVPCVVRRLKQQWSATVSSSQLLKDLVFRPTSTYTTSLHGISWGVPLTRTTVV